MTSPNLLLPLVYLYCADIGGVERGVDVCIVVLLWGGLMSVLCWCCGEGWCLYCAAVADVVVGPMSNFPLSRTPGGSALIETYFDWWAAIFLPLGGDTWYQSWYSQRRRGYALQECLTSYPLDLRISSQNEGGGWGEGDSFGARSTADSSMDSVLFILILFCLLLFTCYYFFFEKKFQTFLFQYCSFCWTRPSLYSAV